MEYRTHCSNYLWAEVAVRRRCGMFGCLNQHLRHVQRSAFICNGLLRKRELVVKIMSELVAYRANLIKIVSDVFTDPGQGTRNPNPGRERTEWSVAGKQFLFGVA